MVTGLLLVTLGGCGGDTTTAETGGAATPGERLDAIVIAEDDPPADTEFVRATRGPAVAELLLYSRSADLRAQVKKGLVDGLVNEFLSADLAAAVEEETAEASPGEIDAAVASPGRLAIASWAAAYRDAESADVALRHYLGELGDRPALRYVSETPFGDDRGGLYEGEDGGIPTRVYVWRAGPYVLHLDADGSVRVDAARIEALARGMQERASG